MSSILQNAKEGLHLDGRVSEVIWGTQGVPNLSTIA